MEQRDRPTWPIPIGLIVAVVAGFLIYQSPLKSSRPVAMDSERLRALDEQQVEARLWQDPLAAVEEHARSEASKKQVLEFRVEQGALQALEKPFPEHDHHQLDVLRNQLKTIVTASSGYVTMLFVMAPGGSYVEGMESRIRTRYAVVSALGVSCFVPEDSEHIGYVGWKPHPPPSMTLPYDKLNVPYEWYRPRKFQQCKGASDQPQKILVLWINEDGFSQEPLRRLSLLIADIKGHLDGRRIQVKTIGPASSTTLRSMLEDVLERPAGQSSSERVVLYSPWATAHPGLLALSVQEKMDPHTNHPYAWYEKQFAAVLGRQVDLHQGIGSDDRLARTLFEELDRRGLQIGQDHIAWLSEWDSFYSRSLQMEFSAAACVIAERQHSSSERVCPDISHAMDAVINEDPRLPWSGRSWLHHYSYLRGLDGEIPTGKGIQSKNSVSGKGSSKGAENSAPDVKELARPEGQSQLDYVQRLVDRMEADAGQWEGSGKELKAIGVLGSDVYDKLLILQAVRKRFPHAVFFTTDLDARLLHPSQYEWTRNLVIASHFGLQLHPSLQDDIPSFRDSYQTSAFFSVLASLNQFIPQEASNRSLPQDPNSFYPTEPRLYEVGRTQAVDLSLDAPDETTRSTCEQVHGGHAEKKATLHPPRSKFEVWHETGCGGLVDTLHNLRYNHAMWAVVAVFLGCVLLIPFNVQLATIVFGSAVLIGVTVFVFWRLSLDPGGEPFYWFEGVSIWPTEIFRIVATGLSLFFLYRAISALRRNRARLTRDVLEQTPTTDAPTGETASLPRWQDWVNPSAWGIHYNRGHVTLRALWEEYGRLSQSTSQWSRVIPQVFVYSFFGFALLLGVFTPPHTPFRGSVSGGADKLALCLSVFSFLVLTFFIVDETRLCEQFIRRLADLCCRTSAPEPRLIRFSIDLVAARTKVVGRLIDYPFIILLILVVGRMRVFDNWDVPLGLVLLWGISAGYAIVCAFLLGRAAEHLRKTGTGLLITLRDDAKQAGKPAQAEYFEQMVDRIAAERDGAFAPWTQHPIFRAVLFPTGGFGIASLLEYFSLG